MNVTRLTAWAGAILAVLAVSTAGLTGAKWLIAQEYTKQMAPVQEQLDAVIAYILHPDYQALDEIIQQNRVDSDRESLIFCLEYKHEDATAEERKVLCAEESAERWVEWKRQDDAKKEKKE